MFTAASFKIAKKWKQHKYPSAGEDKQNVVYSTMYNIEK